MLHPSYSDLFRPHGGSKQRCGARGTACGTERYSIVIAAAKRARMIIDGDEPMVYGPASKKPLSAAVEELYEQKVKILNDEPDESEEKEVPEALETEWESGE